MVTVPFNEWLPDQPDHNNPGLVDAKNVYRRDGAYHPVKAIQFPGGAQSGDLGVTNSIVYDAVSAKNSGVESYAIASGSNELLAVELDPVLVSSTAVSMITGDQCNFVNYDGDIYFFARGSEQYKSTRGAAFALVSSATQFGPAAAAKVSRFIMTGARTEIQWSAFNDPEDWTPSQRTQAGSATLNTPELGDITGIVDGFPALIFQEKGFSRLEYVGPPLVWSTQLVSAGYGAVHGSPIEVNRVVYFIGASSVADGSTAGAGGFAVYKTNGAQAVRVSDGKVSDWLRQNFSTASVPTRSSRRAIFDETRRQVIWRSGTGDGPHHFLCMNVDTEEFTYFEADYKALIPGPFHDAANAGEIIGIAHNGSNLHFGPLSGATLEATLTTGHLAAERRWTKTRSVEPVYSGAGATVALSAKAKLRDSASFGAYQVEDENGDFGIRSGGRSTAISVKFPAGSDWSDLTEVKVDVEDGGKR